MASLSAEQVQHYERDGFVCPLPAIGAEGAARLAADLDAIEDRFGTDVWSRAKVKPHLLIKSLNDLVRTPAIVDAVEAVLGPDVLVWAVGRFAKAPRSPGFITWHQDATYWALSEPAVVTAWVALTPSHRANGCMRVVPGSHKAAQLPHRDTFGENNMLSRGQEVAVDVDEREAVDLVLQPGEMSLHHTMLVHGSEPNRSDVARTGIAIRYIAARVSHGPDFRDSATLVRGKDRAGHYIPEPQPVGDFDPDSLRFYEDIVGDFRARKEAIAKAQPVEAESK